jgi:hypothetical protein
MEGGGVMAVTKAGITARRKYNDKTYAKVFVELPKDLVADFKEKCKAEGISQASVFRAAMEQFLDEEVKK